VTVRRSASSPPKAAGDVLADTALVSDSEDLLTVRRQIEDSRAELALLDRQLQSARHALAGGGNALLREANQQLLISAVQADENVEAVKSDLDLLIHSSQRDDLTGLPNRPLMMDRLEGAIASARRRGTRVGVLFLDVDHFKQVNDSHGHAVGDDLLRDVARCLAGAIRESDTASRHGGDEFLVVLVDIGEATDAGHVFSKLRSELALFRFGRDGNRLTISAGVALYPRDGTTAAELIERADGAMYRAKQLGGDRCEFHALDDS
jgi:diguanylate cyclase (GGDEF)-like protein